MHAARAARLFMLSAAKVRDKMCATRENFVLVVFRLLSNDILVLSRCLNRGPRRFVNSLISSYSPLLSEV